MRSGCGGVPFSGALSTHFPQRMAPALRVLTVGSLPPEWGGSARGGVATFHAALLAGLRERGDVEVVGVLPPTEPTAPVPFPVFARPPDQGLAEFYERTLDRLRPDAVLLNHVANTVGVTHVRLGSPVPAVGVAHSWHNITFADEDDRARALEVTEEALAGLGALVVPSEHCRREGEALGLSLPARTEVIHYPLQPLYLDDPGDLEAGERRGALFVGSFAPRKRPEALVEAAALLPGLEATLVGEGELEPQLRERAEALGLRERVRVTALAGDDHPERLRQAMREAEVLCLPSGSESFGIVFAEALACGTPVVGFGPTVREISATLGCEVGAPLDVGEPARLADAIERVRSRAWDRDDLHRRAVEAFDLSRTVGRYVEVLRPGGDPNAPAVARPTPAAQSGSPRRGRAPICVLGMSRTGSSLTTRILNLSGVELGPQEEMREPMPANPEGFWENAPITRINERILKSFGGSWHDPPPLPPGWELAEKLEPEREQARALLAQTFAGHELWGWKDPRNSITLPFWQRLVPALRYVICLRNPVDVAASLERRDEIEAGAAFEQWLAYVASALVNTAGWPRVLVSYEEYFGDWRAPLARLAGFVADDGGKGDADPATQLWGRSLSEAVDERLWHHRTPPEEVVADTRLPRPVAALYLVTELLRAAQDAPDREGFDDLDRAANRFARDLLDERRAHAATGPHVAAAPSPRS
jgi:glycosyltransferase involved in cell wall biosynthesis